MALYKSYFIIISIMEEGQMMTKPCFVFIWLDMSWWCRVTAAGVCSPNTATYRAAGMTHSTRPLPQGSVANISYQWTTRWTDEVTWPTFCHCCLSHRMPAPLSSRIRGGWRMDETGQWMIGLVGMNACRVLTTLENLENSGNFILPNL